MSKNISRNITFALIGWAGGVISTLILGLTWPYIFPAVVRPEHYYGSGPGLWTIIGITLLIATPAAVVGGIIGGRLSVEGGRAGQRLIAIIAGITLATPCGCAGLWFFTGF